LRDHTATTTQVLEAMRKGAVLCLGHEGFEQVYWLEPKRIIIRRDVAQRIIGLPGIVPVVTAFSPMRLRRRGGWHNEVVHLRH
jgi:hypothetical protein